MVAHDLFVAPDNGSDGVEFIVAKATGKLQFPQHVWSVDEVERKSDELLTMRDKLKTLSSRLSYADIVKALMDQGDNKQWELSAERTPIAALFALAPLGPETPQPPSDPDSPPPETTDAKAPETPKEHRE